MGSVLKLINVGSNECEQLSSIRQEVELFSKELLTPYIQLCKDYCKENSLSFENTKSIFDPVWGNIELYEGEIFLIDSPLIQRLRRIKQLGLVDLLYSSANHTRFSHTLGVLNASELMATQIIKELNKSKLPYDEDIIQILRLSAIFHDCGHFFCSHATEIFFQNDTFYSQYQRVDKARKFFFSRLRIQPSITEIISVLILNSPSVKELLSILDKGFCNLDYNNHKDELIIEKVACLILGYPYNKESIPFSRIINGEIDADKIDYIRRDAYSTGLPSSVDMSRIMQKLRISECLRPLSMVSENDVTEQSARQIAIAPSAINTIDQLMITRFMMFENVYFHPKTVAFETYFRYALRYLDNSTKGVLDNFQNILQLCDSDLISNSLELKVKAFDEFQELVPSLFNKSKEMFKNLYDRNLLKRSVVIDKQNIIYFDQDQKEFYENLFENKIVEKQELLINRIKEMFLEVYNALHENSPISLEQVDILLMIAPDYSNVDLNSNVAIADKKRNFRDNIFEADNWLKSRTSRTRHNYIITNNNFRFYVLLASELILFLDYGIGIHDTEIYDKEDEKTINRYKIKLEEKHFYDKAIALLHDEDLAGKEDYFKEISEKWGPYEIIDPIIPLPQKIDKTYISMYLQQFYKYKQELGEFEVFVNEACDLLSSIHIVNKREIVQSLESNMNQILEAEHCSPEEILLCSLGDFQDSSSQIGYYINTINEKFRTNWIVKRIDKIDKTELKPTIVFLDDAFYSGSQLKSIFQTLVNYPIEEREVKETHLNALAPSILENIQGSRVYLSFIYKNKFKEEEIKNYLRNEMNFRNLDIVADKEFPKPYFESITTAINPTPVIKKYFQKIGRDLIVSKAYDENGNLRPRWTESRINESYLGYENAQQTIIFPWNTPVFNITALWLKCNNSNLRWFPLFPRVDKKK